MLPIVLMKKIASSDTADQKLCTLFLPTAKYVCPS